jgi:hypothetical protein
VARFFCNSRHAGCLEKSDDDDDGDGDDDDDDARQR